MVVGLGITETVRARVRSVFCFITRDDVAER